MEKMEKKVKELSLKELRDLVLENKTITVKPIVRSKPYLKKGHDGEHTYTGCSKDEGLPFNADKRAYENPFFSQEEQEIFERLLDQKEGSLNLYNYSVYTPNFWGNFLIKIPKEGVQLDLNNPSDALMYRVILKNPRFATSVTELGIAERIYHIVNENEVKEKESELGAKKDKANDYMYKIKKTKKTMYDTLRLLGKKVDKEATAEWMKSELYKIIDEVTVTKGVAGLDKFITVMEDPTSDLKLFVMDAIDSKDITTDKVGYKLTDSGKFLGKKFEEVVDYFTSKDPSIQETKLIIQERLKH
jgi:hypothetical protein